jgi:hypothetical protein
MTDYGFVRVSTGSQDAQTQRRDIAAFAPGAQIVTTDTKSASASKGQQMDALDAVIGKLRKGDRVIVTDSSRLDRRDNLTSQVETMLAIRGTGALIVSLAPGEEQFANGDDLGSWITTLVKQNANAEKSRTVKTQTWRGIQAIIANRAFCGQLPAFWGTVGGKKDVTRDRFNVRAVCTNPDAVADIYARADAGESLMSIARVYDVYPQSIRNLLRFEANYTGVITCSYTHDGETDTWSHAVEPVIGSALWHRVNSDDKHAQRGGRPVAEPANWISGVLRCPECGGRLYVNAGKTPAGNARTPRLRCGGQTKTRQSCGRFKGYNAERVILAMEILFSRETTEVLAFQRVTGNAHELEDLKATLARLQARLSVTDDDDALDALVAQRKTLRAEIGAFTVIPDSFDYAPTGQTVAEMWTEADDAARRNMVKAVVKAMGMTLEIRPDAISFTFSEASADDAGIVDLGSGLCFRKTSGEPSGFTTFVA